jgi:hypothetical protein
LEVTPVTCWSLASPARLPVISRPRLMSSSQMLTPAAASWPRMSSFLSVMAIRSLVPLLG